MNEINERIFYKLAGGRWIKILIILFVTLAPLSPSSVDIPFLSPHTLRADVDDDYACERKSMAFKIKRTLFLIRKNAVYVLIIGCIASIISIVCGVKAWKLFKKNPQLKGKARTIIGMFFAIFPFFVSILILVLVLVHEFF